VETPEYCHPEGSRTEGPYDILRQWFSDMINGLLPENVCGMPAPRCARYEYFRWGDAMTQALWMTDEFANIYLAIERLAIAGETSGRMDYHYSDMGTSEVAKNYLQDMITHLNYATTGTKAVFGNDPIISITGSFDVEWEVVGYDDGNPVVEYHVQNATTLYSGTRIPGITPSRGDGNAGSGADAYGGEHYMIQSYRFRITACVNGREWPGTCQ
jgi:hypothetical protein